MAFLRRRWIRPSLPTSLPRIVADLGGIGLFPWVFTAFMVSFTVTVPIAGKLTDIYGRKPFYMGGIVILLLGSALAGSAQSMEMMIAFRAVQGLGAGLILSIAFAIIGDIFPPAERGKWNGLFSGVFATASVAGPLIGGYLTDNIDWRWVFYVNLPLGGIAITTLLVGMPSLRPARHKAKLDYRGAALLISSVMPLLLALSWAGSRFDWMSYQVIGLFGGCRNHVRCLHLVSTPDRRAANATTAVPEPNLHRLDRRSLPIGLGDVWGHSLCAAVRASRRRDVRHRLRADHDANDDRSGCIKRYSGTDHIPTRPLSSLGDSWAVGHGVGNISVLTDGRWDISPYGDTEHGHLRFGPRHESSPVSPRCSERGILFVLRGRYFISPVLPLHGWDDGCRDHGFACQCWPRHQVYGADTGACPTKSAGGDAACRE